MNDDQCYFDFRDWIINYSKPFNFLQRIGKSNKYIYYLRKIIKQNSLVSALAKLIKCISGLYLECGEDKEIKFCKRVTSLYEISCHLDRFVTVNNVVLENKRF
jgi:hypothetical protein